MIHRRTRIVIAVVAVLAIVKSVGNVVDDRGLEIVIVTEDVVAVREDAADHETGRDREAGVKIVIATGRHHLRRHMRRQYQ